MAECENFQHCGFISDRLVKRPQLASLLKRNYCNKDSSKCARFLVLKKLGAAGVPDALFPNQMDKAVELLASPAEKQ